MGSKVCLSIVGNTLWIWQYRNDAFHADDEVQTKQYKLEALGRNKSQLRARFASLQYTFCWYYYRWKLAGLSERPITKI
jgi:hypothetical protein